MMTKNHTLMRFVLAIPVAILFCSVGTWAQPIPITGGTVGELLRDPVFLKASLYKEAFRYDEAIEEFRKVALSHPNTEVEAEALCQVANLLHLRSSQEIRRQNTAVAAQLKEESQAQYRVIAQKFPNTKYWFKAQASFSESKEDYDELLVEVGGVAREDISSGRVTKLPVDQIPIQYREYLWTSYDGMGETTEEKQRFFQFIRFTFPEVSGTAIVRLRELYHPPEITDDSLDITPPIVEVLHPTDGALVSPSDASLKLIMNDGDLIGRQIDLSKSTIELDGQSIFNDCVFNSEIDPDGPVFELLTISYTPPLPLSTGSHFYRIVAAELGGEKQTERIINFTVGTPPPPPPMSIDSDLDTILLERNTHQNEGANSLLTLEKIQGKATRSAVAFDLANIDLSNLSKATLVLTIDEDEHVNGWGNGRTITVQALTAPWQEGNGKSFGLKKKDAVAGSGPGATWFSPLDEDISNDSANGTLSWNGGAVNAPTAPAVVITNHQTGEVAFDVTSDLLNGAENGWLISKDEENAGSKVSFYSKEGAAAAGDSELAPKLILEFGGSIASNTSSSSLLSKLGFSSGDITLRPESRTTELRSMREHLQQSPVAALIIEQTLSQSMQSQPLIGLASRTAYRSWLSDDLQLANGELRALTGV